VNIPNKENIDRWLFDWTEGNLSPSQEFLLQEFLLLNPDLESDAEAWDATSVSSIPFTYSNQESLKRKKRRILGYWQFYAAACFVLTIGASLFYGLSQNNEVKSTQNNKTQVPNKSKISLKNNIKTGLKEINPTLLGLSSYKKELTNNSLIEDKDFFISMANYSPSLKEPENFNNYDNLSTKSLIDYQIADNSSSNESSLNDFISYDMSSTENLTEEKNDKVKKSLSISLKLNPSSSISKWLKKEVTNTNQKERIYSLPEKSNLDINSSFAGNTSQFKFQSMSTARWMNTIDQQKIAQQISMDGYIRSAKSGLGMVANYSTFGNGLIQDWNINFIYAPKLALNRYITIEPSMKYTFGKKVLDNTKIVNNANVEFETNHLEIFSIDPSKPIGKNLWYRDLGAGLVINAGPVYLGGQLTNILKHQDNIYSNDYSSVRKANQELTLIGGTDFISKNGFYNFSPYLCHTISGTVNTTYLGASVQIKSFLVGGSIQPNGSSSAMIGLNSNRFALFCQSSYVLSSVSQQKSFIHQLTFRINSNISKKVRRYLYL
jgi:hypothetical protein